ncbi:MAG: hypothetical protein AAF797_04305, partial [Planctomycetota bacterium]
PDGLGVGVAEGVGDGVEGGVGVDATPSHTLRVWSKSLDQRPNSLLRNHTHAHPSFNAVAYAFGHTNSQSVRLRFHHPSRTLDTGAGQVLMGPAFPPLATPPAGIHPRHATADTQRLLAPLLTPTPTVRQHPGLTTPFASLSRHGKRWFLYHHRGRFPVPQPPLAAPVISPDARRVAFVTRRAPGRPQQLAFTDTQNPFDPIALGPAFAHIHPTPTFSPNSQTLAHAATTLPTPSQPPHATLALNHLASGHHQTLGTFNAVLSTPVFSRDSQRLTVLVNTQGQNRLATFEQQPNGTFIGPTLGPAFLSILHPAYLPDGRLVHWARTAPGQWQLVIDHQPDPDYTSDTPGQFTFTPTLNPTTNQATLAATIKEDGYAYAVINGKRGPATQAIGQHSLRLCPDGRSVAYAVQHRHQWFIALNHRPLSPGMAHDQIAPHTLRFSPDSQRFAYAALDRGQWQLYTDERPVFTSPLPTAPVALTFTHDSQHLVSHAPLTPEALGVSPWGAPHTTPAPPSTSPLPTSAVYLDAEPVLRANAPIFLADPTALRPATLPHPQHANLILDPNLFPDPAFHAGPDGVRFAVRALTNNAAAPGPSIHLGHLTPTRTKGPRQAP